MRAAGVSAWILSGTPAVLMVQGLRIGDLTVELTVAEFATWLGAALLFIAAFWLTTAAVGKERFKTRSRYLLVVQTAAALLMFQFVCTGLETTLLALVAAQLGLFFPLPVGLLWVCAQTAALISLAWIHWGAQIGLAWIALTTPFAVLALFVSYFAGSESDARRELARTNAELQATQQLLAESSRLAERSRISRDLHDLLGHHLVALSLQLETAIHRLPAGGEGRESIEKAQGLTKKLLGDLRTVVREVRGDEVIDLSRILRPLVSDIPRPKIHLDLPQDLSISDPERAQALVRCIQEIVTNAVKHAAADNLWIELARTEQGIELRARDDGRGSARIRPGRGLAGMRERLSEFGGSLEFQAVPGQGFRLNALIPPAGG